MTVAEIILSPLASYEKKIKRIHVLVHGMMSGTLNGVVISGSPGIGKSHNVMEALESYGDKINIVEVKGHITPFTLFTTMCANCNENDVILLDDADSGFENSASLNILKAACDTKAIRVVSWLSSANQGDQSFIFKGKVIILTNASLKKNPHYMAMMDRFIVYNPDVTLEEKLHKIRQLASQNIEVSEEIGKQVIDFLFTNEDKLADLTIRTFVKAASLASSLGDDWEDIAEAVMFK